MQKIKNIFRSNKPKPPEPVQLSQEQQLQQALFTLLAWKDFSEQQLQSQLVNLTDQILWADKNSEQTMAKVVESQLFDTTLADIYGKHPQPVLQMCILLLTNLKNNIRYVMKSELSKRIMLQQSEDEQVCSYIVSWLRAFSQRLTADTVQDFVQGDRSQLLERCAKLSKSNDPMKRTTCLNIILNVIKMDLPELKPCLVSESFSIFYVNLCDYFNQELVEVDKQLLSLTEEKFGSFCKSLEDLDDLLLFFEDLSMVKDEGIVRMVGTVVYQYLIVPSILTSMRIKESGLISINLALYIVIRMLKIIDNLQMTQLVVRDILAPGAIVEYWVDPADATVEQKTANLMRLLSRTSVSLPLLTVEGIRQSLFMFCRSKDDNLLYLTTTLLLIIIRSRNISKEVRQQCGLCMRQDDPVTRKTREELIGVLCEQFKCMYRVITLKNIGLLIVQLSIIGNDFNISNESRTSLCDAYREAIVSAKQAMKDSSQYDKIAQYFQQDIKYINQKIMDIPQTVGRQAFSVPGVEDEKLSFLEKSPTNADETIRYNFIVFSFLRRLRYMLIKESMLPPEEQNIQKLYNNRLMTEASMFKPGDCYSITNRLLYPCSVINNNFIIPCFIVDDDINFVVALQSESKLKIIINMRFKMLNPVIDHRDICKITIKLRAYNCNKEIVEDKQSILIKCSDSTVAQKIASMLITKKSLNRQAELSFISKLISNSQKDLPTINLLDL